METAVSGRQVGFTSIQEIEDHYAQVKAIIYEAIEIEKSGAKNPLKESG
jgi:uncharacterized protein YdeI (YjbR/CyaY-like superfamily)